jgi:hypothetical protein
MPSPQINPGLATDFSIAAATPHVMVYRFWIKKPGEVDWTQIGEGRTNDAVADHFIVVPPLPPGSQFGYWIGVGGPMNTSWRARLTIAQNGAQVTGGEWPENGTIATPSSNGLGTDQRNAVVAL